MLQKEKKFLIPFIRRHCDMEEKQSYETRVRKKKVKNKLHSLNRKGKGYRRIN